MKMEFSFEGHICSIIQVVALVVCFQRNVSSERAQGCVGSQLSVRCPEMKVIQITAVVLGDSNCYPPSCCIRDNDCTHAANENHTVDVHRTCDNKQSCTVDVLKEKIPCGYLSWSNNDFERITYFCVDETRNVTKNSTDVQPTVDTFSHSSGPNANGYEEGHTRETFLVIVCVVSLIVIIAIVASVSVATVRRKKRHQVNSSDAVKKSDLEADREEAIYVNEAQGTSLEENAGSSFPIYSNDSSTEVEKSLTRDAKNLETSASDYCELQCDSEYLQLYEPVIVLEQPQVEKSLNSGENPTSDYCELEGVAVGRIQRDSKYEQLDHGRNYEPLVVYEQLQ